MTAGRARALRAVLAALLAACVTTADAAVEVVLRGGRVVAGESARREGAEVVVVSAAGRLRFPADRVVAIREGGARPGAGSLNMSSARDADEDDDDDGPRDADAAGPAVASGVALAADAIDADDLAAAERRLRDRVVADPSDRAARVALADVLVRAGRFAEAVAQARSAGSDLAPDVRAARDLVLARALWRLDRNGEALAVLDAMPAGKAAAAAAELRARIADDAREGEAELASDHFTLQLPAGTDARTARALLPLLEAAWQEVRGELGDAPRERIVVLIFPGTEFWERTGMGANVGGLFDGKVRVPAGRIDPPSAALEAVLRHEVAHAFVDELSGGRAGVDWHEGIAEHFEGSDASRTDAELAQALARDPAAWPPPMTHANAHARLAWFLRRHGMSAVRDLLRGLARGMDADAALRSACGMTHDELHAAWAAALRGGD